MELPAELTLAGGETLVCTQILRLLPGKRVVMRGRWKGRAVLVKLLRDSVSGRRAARRELAGHGVLRAAKIPTPELLFSDRCNDRGHVLVFEFLQQAQCLGDLWRSRMEIAGACLDLIARLHRAGCRHTDLHLDNFLLADDRLYVIDAASVERRANGGGGYGKWQRENVALFLAQFPPLRRKALLDSLAQHYAEAAADPRLEVAVEKCWRHRKSRYLKKCLRTCSEFSTLSYWRRAAVWKRDFHCDELTSFLHDPDAWVESGLLLKNGKTATVVRVRMGKRQVVIKRNNIKNLFHWLRRCLRTTRCRRNWHNAHLLAINGIATPEPIAFVEERWGPFRFRGYYVCVFDDAPSAAQKYLSQQPTERELANFRELFTAMRLARLYHGDCKSSNFLIGEDHIALIDLDSITECRSKKMTNRLLKRSRRRFLKNWRNDPKKMKRFSEVFEQA